VAKEKVGRGRWGPGEKKRPSFPSLYPLLTKETQELPQEEASHHLCCFRDCHVICE